MTENEKKVRAELDVLLEILGEAIRAIEDGKPVKYNPTTMNLSGAIFKVQRLQRLLDGDPKMQDAWFGEFKPEDILKVGGEDRIKTVTEVLLEEQPEPAQRKRATRHRLMRAPLNYAE